MRAKAETTVGVIWGFFLRLVVLGLLGYTIYRVRSIVITILLSVMVTYIALPAVEFLCSWRVRGWSRRSQRFWASVLVFLSLLAVFGVMTRHIIVPFNAEATQLIANYDTHVKNLEKVANRVTTWYRALPEELKSLFGEEDKKSVRQAIKEWGKGVFRSTVDWLGHALHVILIPVLAFYFALDYRSLRREFVGALPKSRRREALTLLRSIGGILQNYAVGQLILCVIAGVAVGLLLWGLEMNYALALGVFAGVTRAIPIVGPIVSGSVIALLGLLKAPIIGLYLLACFAALHFVESKFILPKLIGYQMRLHPAIVIVSLLIGGEFFGLMGMFLAAPAAAVIRELIRFYVIAPRARAEAAQEPA